MNDCNFCRYIENENDSTKQTCAKWVNKDNFNKPCRPPGKEPGEAPLSEADNCKKMDCRDYFQYPYTKKVYNDADHPEEHYDHLGMKPAYRYLNTNPEALTSYLSNATNNEMIKEELKEYNSQNIPQDLDLPCGELVAPEEGNVYKFPDLPSEDTLKQTIDYNVDYMDRGIDWSKIKKTEKLESNYANQIDETNNTVVMNDYTIPLADNGIQLEWWDRPQVSDEQLKLILPSYIRDYQKLENIHKITGGILQHIFPVHNVGRMVVEQVYDWLMKNNIERVEEGEGESSEDGKFTMAKFFGITTDDVINYNFETCMNQLMTTEHDDDKHLRRIHNYTKLTDLGDPKNREDLLYIEAKILKFLMIEPNEFEKCLDIVYLTDEICKVGLTSNPTQMMGKFLKMNTDNVDDEKYNDKMRIITNKLLKYLPNLIQKVIDISEYYEKQKCNGEVHKNTKLLKEIYSGLFTQNNMKVDLPDLGVSQFFQDFEKNIYTKIILLIFIAYVVAQFIKLFTVNFNLTGGK